MNSEYPLIPLGEVAKVYSGFAFKGSDMGKSGYPIIKIKNIYPPMVDIENCDYIPEEIIQSIPNFDRYLLHSGDTLIAMTGATAGKVGRFYSDSNNYFLNQRVGKVHIYENNLSNAEYIYQILSTKKFSRDILALSSGSAQGNISGSQIETYKIPLPPIEIQNSIGNILGTLDKKIKLNKQTNQTLKEIAKSLFRSWFIDFNPVKAKAEDRSTGLAKEISDLFPDTFEDSEVGAIPNGWEIYSLNQVSSYLSRGISPKYCNQGQGVSVINQKCIRDGTIDFSKSRNNDPLIKKIDGREIKKFDCLINSTGVGTLGRVAMTPDIGRETIIVDSHVTVVRGKNTEQSFFLTMLLLHRQSEIESLGEGSTGQTELSRKILGDLVIIFPSQKLINKFYIYSLSLLEKKWLNEKTIINLSELRDTLLPKLISGELRIPDAEKMIEDAEI